MLKKELAELKQEETELESVLIQYPEIIDEMTEEEKEGDYLNDDNTAFVPAKVKAYCKNANIFGYNDELTVKIKRANTLIEKEKKLKKEVKEKTWALHLLTKETIEGLSDANVLMLLDLKWIQPLCRSLAALPLGVINDLVAKTRILAEKYAVTYVDLESQIKESERSLSALIDDLEGSEFDMLGLREFQKLLGANDDGK